MPQGQDAMGSGAKITESRYFELAEGDELLDSGTFVARDEAGKEAAQEEFTIVRRRRKGLFKRQGGGLSVTGLVRTSDGDFVMDARMDYDRNANPVLAETAVRGRFEGLARDWIAGFVFKPPKAVLKITERKNPLDLTIACEKGWMIDIDPSILPAAVLLHRLATKKGEQEFTWIAYAAQNAHFGIGRHLVEVSHVERMRAKDAGGERTKLDYFIADEIALDHLKRRLGLKRRIHLWADENRRLRKAVAVLPHESYTFTRPEEEDSAAHWKPKPELVRPQHFWLGP